MTGSPPPVGPVTDHEQLGWQARAVAVLAGLLARAHQAGLPPVAWTVSDAGAGLAARCFGLPVARRRADFDAWCAALGAARWPERTTGTRTRLHAVARHYDGLVTVTVTADLFDDDAAAGQALLAERERREGGAAR